MTYKSLILGILTVAISFGVLISGCNRDRNRTAMNATSARRSQSVRPAEVLSASAYRPPARTYAAAPMTVQPQPMPAYASVPAPVYTQTYTPAPVYQQPVVVHPTPELAMARAAMAPMPLPPPAEVMHSRPVVAPVYHAPIPELEPARYRPVVASLPQPRQPSAGMMVTNVQYQGDRQEIQRALAPLPQAQPRPTQLTHQGWVASPTTAMRPLNY